MLLSSSGKWPFMSWHVGWKDDPETLSWLKVRARDQNPEVRGVAIQELARGWKNDRRAESDRGAGASPDHRVYRLLAGGE